jgi:hypothetical protein
MGKLRLKLSRRRRAKVRRVRVWGEGSGGSSERGRRLAGRMTKLLKESSSCRYETSTRLRQHSESSRISSTSLPSFHQVRSLPLSCLPNHNSSCSQTDCMSFHVLRLHLRRPIHHRLHRRCHLRRCPLQLRCAQGRTRPRRLWRREHRRQHSWRTLLRLYPRSAEESERRGE